MCILHGNKYEQSCRRFESFECCACCCVDGCESRIHDFDEQGSSLVSSVDNIMSLYRIKMSDEKAVLRFLQEERTLTEKEVLALNSLTHLRNNRYFLYETIEKELTNKGKDSYKVPEGFPFGYNEFKDFALNLVGKNWLNMRKLCNKDGIYNSKKSCIATINQIDTKESESYDLYLDEYIFSRIEDRATPSVLFNIVMDAAKDLDVFYHELLLDLYNNLCNYLVIVNNAK